MARHRSDATLTGPAPRHPTDPSTGEHPAAARPPAAPSLPAARTSSPLSGPLPVVRADAGRHRSDPDTTPLDLAAIAVATAAARRRDTPANDDGPQRPRRPLAEPPDALPTTGGAHRVAEAPPTTGALPAPGEAGAPGGAGSHRAAPAPGAVGRVLRPTRAASALALVGAIAGAGVAAAGGGSLLSQDGPATDTGEFRRPPEPTVDDRVARANAAPVAGPVAAAPGTTTRSAPKTTAATPRSRSPAAAPPEPAAAAPRPVDDGRTLWSADFASAGLGNFKSTPWNNQGAKAPTLGGGLVNFAMPGGGKRSEIEPDFRELREGDDYFFGFSVRLDDDFPVDGSDWQVITQFKNDGTGSPPLEVKVQDGKFVLDGGSGAFSEVIGDARPGQWTHLALNVKFSSSDGSVSAWQDGVPTLSDYRPTGGTLYDGRSSYLKIGIYRDSSIEQDGRLAFRSWAIGTSLGAVGENASASGRDASGGGED